MSLTIETELKDIFTKIDSRLERIEQSQTDLKLSVVQYLATTLSRAKTPTRNQKPATSH